MKIEQLCLQNFRNFETLTLPVDGKNQIIAGQNAQGKSNLLEAIHLCSMLRSFRGAKEAQMIRHGQAMAQVSLQFQKEGRHHEISVQLFSRSPKKIFLDGREIRRQRDILGCFQTVVFTPDHLQMLKGGPGQRRAFLDMAICMTNPRYTDALLQYGKALKNRNRVLKESENIPSLLQTLPVWDEMLCNYGGQIAAARAEYIEQISPIAKEFYSEIGIKDEQKIKILYINSYSKNRCSATEYAALMRERLEKAREADKAAGSTTFGVHKDDFLLLLGGKNIRYFGSQGQIRSGVLALKLAEAKVLEQQSGSAPVLLLDDIFSELDPTRQQYFIEQSFSNQCMITTCEQQKLSDFEGQLITVQRGEVR